MSRLTRKQIEKIIEVYNETNSLEKTSKITGHMTTTVSSYVKHLSSAKTHNKNCSNKVNQIDPNTNKVIKEWFKPSVASRELGINPSCLCRALKGELKTAGGYRWEKV